MVRHRRAGLFALIMTGAAACGPTAGGGIGAGGIDKSAYTLFTPTPREHMRAMSTDRPDTTESPRSVDAGHVQVELGVIDFAYDEDDGVRTETLTVMPSNVKLGLTSAVDLQLVFTPYVRVRTASRGHDDVIDGFGDDTQLRLKVNLWGNDGPDAVLGPTALAVMPYVKFPTGAGALGNDHVEGGVILPFAADLPADFGLGLMGEVDAVYDAESGGYGVELLHTVAISRDVPRLERLGAFVEYVGVSPHGIAGTYQALAKSGLTYGVTDDWVLDCGIAAGLSESADDVSGFTGMSFRY